MDEQDDLELKILLAKRLQEEKQAAGKILDQTKKFNDPEMIQKNTVIEKIKNLIDILP